MKKIFIALMFVFSLISCTETKEHILPQYVNELRNINHFDTVLVVQGEKKTYFFDYKTKTYMNYVSTKEITTTETINNDGASFLLLIFLIIILLILVMA